MVRAEAIGSQVDINNCIGCITMSFRGRDFPACWNVSTPLNIVAPMFLGWGHGCYTCSHLLVWFRIPPFQGDDTGSNPVESIG